MRRRHRHLTLGNGGASLCWDSRPLTDSDGASLTSWVDRVTSLTADQASNAPTVRRAIQGGQPVVRFGASTSRLATANTNVARNKAAMTVIAVAAATNVSATVDQLVGQAASSSTGSARCALFIRSVRSEAGGRRLDANSYQSAQGGVMTNSTFGILAGLFDWANAALTAYLNGIGSSRAGGFQTAGNSSDTAFPVEIGGYNITGGRLNGDVGLLAFVETSSAVLRRRFEHAAAYSFKIACN